MTAYAEQRVLAFTPQQLFDLVRDIESYPQFLPWCTGARVLSRQDPHLIAELVIGFAFFREKYQSMVTLQPPYEIEARHIHGPLKYLHNHWRFQPHPDGCLLDFSLEFEFQSPILQKLVGVLLEEAVKRMVSAFEKRAYELYSPTPLHKTQP